MRDSEPVEAKPLVIDGASDDVASKPLIGVRESKVTRVVAKPINIL